MMTKICLLIAVLTLQWRESASFLPQTQKLAITKSASYQFHSSTSHSLQLPSNKDTYDRRNSISRGVVSLPSIDFARAAPKFGLGLISRTFSEGITKLQASLIILLATFAGFQMKLKNKVKNVSAMESGWLKRGNGGGFTRTVEVWIFAISFIYKYFQVKKLEKKDKEAYSKGLSNIARILTLKILELGPTFIKLGQLLSTRIDVFPREFINELTLLQDQVPGFDGDIAVKIIERELGKPIEELFDTFDRKYIAAASLGQVHIATKNGQRFAVKVQRQGLKDLFDMDLKNIKVLAILLDKFDPKADGAQRDWSSIYDESARLLYKEIDYREEALNSIRFRENFRDVSWVKVPEVYLNMTTQNVVTMEYVPGIKINDIKKIEAAGIDRQLLAKRSAESYLTQICRHGFFRKLQMLTILQTVVYNLRACSYVDCDPHPGNVACDAEQGGRLIYYDFGMMDELKPQVKSGLVDLIFGIYENDVKESCNALEQIGVLKKGVDRLSVEKIARFFLSEFQNGIKPGEKWVSQLPGEKQAEIRKQRRQQLGADLFSVGSDVPFKFPPTFTFVFRAFTSLDGIGKGLDTGYDITRLAQPFLKELVDLRDGSATVSIFKSFAKQVGWRPIDFKNAITQPRKVAYLEETLSKMEQGDLKLRVRVLESERSFKKIELEQKNLGIALAASTFLNAAILLGSQSPAGQLSAAARGAYALAAIFGIQVPIGILKLKALEKKFAGFDSK